MATYHLCADYDELRTQKLLRGVATDDAARAKLEERVALLKTLERVEDTWLERVDDDGSVSASADGVTWTLLVMRPA